MTKRTIYWNCLYIFRPIGSFYDIITMQLLFHAECHTIIWIGGGIQEGYRAEETTRNIGWQPGKRHREKRSKDAIF